MRRAPRACSLPQASGRHPPLYEDPILPKSQGHAVSLLSYPLPMCRGSPVCRLLTSRLMILDSGSLVFSRLPKGRLKGPVGPLEPPVRPQPCSQWKWAFLSLLSKAIPAFLPPSTCACACSWGLNVSRSAGHPSTTNGGSPVASGDPVVPGSRCSKVRLATMSTPLHVSRSVLMSVTR